MKLKIKFLKWTAGLPVSMIHKDTAKELGIKLRDRISIETSSREIYTVVDTVGRLVKKDEIAVSDEIKKRLKLKKGQKVDVNLTIPPQSLVAIKKKLHKKTLTEKEIRQIIKDIVRNSLSESEIALFISSVYKFGMNLDETTFLIKAILDTGKKLNLKNKIIVDKHSIGGIAGRTTPIVVSICSAAGLIIPKTSSRAITTPAGTADAMETIATVDFKMKELEKIIKKTKGFVVWGGGLGMVPADSKIIQVEKMLNMDSETQLIASIMAKKLAVKSNHILIHIPYGKYAKVDKKNALILEDKFKKISRRFKVKLECILTETHGPVGNGIGPALEIIDVIKVLKRQDKCHQLEEKSIFLSGKIFELAGKTKKGKGEELAKNILESGKAFDKFKEIVKFQKGNLDFDKIKLAKFKKDIKTTKSGKIKEINNKKLNSFARLLGCPSDKGAGIYLYVHANDKIKKGDKLLTIYSESRHRLKQAVDYYKKEKIFKFG